MSKEIFRRLVEINARVDGVMARRWVEVVVDVGLLAQRYGMRAYASNGARAQLAKGAVLVRAVRQGPDVPTGTRPSVDVNEGVNCVVGADNIWNNSSAGSLDRKGRK